MRDANDIEEAVYEEIHKEILEFSYRGSPFIVVKTSDTDLWIRACDITKMWDLSNNTTRHLNKITASECKKTQYSGDQGPTWYITPRGLEEWVYSRRGNGKREAMAFYRWFEDEVVPACSSGDGFLELFQETGVEAQTAAVQMFGHLTHELQQHFQEHIHQSLMTFKADALEQQRHLLQDQFEEHKKYLDEYIQHAYDTARQSDVERARVEEKLEKEAELKEEVDKQRRTLESTVEGSRESNKAYQKQLVDQINQLKKDLEEAQASRKKWRKRAKKWGKKVLRHIDRAAYDDQDLGLLQEGMLND